MMQNFDGEEMPPKRWGIIVEGMWPFRQFTALGINASWSFGCPSITIALIVVSITLSYDYGRVL